MVLFRQQQSAESLERRRLEQQRVRRRKPWIEQHRPQQFSELFGQEHAVRLVQSAITHGRLPHLLLCGSPGTGKTSFSKIVARTLFPDPTTRKDRVLEINASDGGGIELIRKKVDTFSSRGAPARNVVTGECGFNLLIFDEADYLTSNAQNALRLIMEKKLCVRFMMTCNKSSAISPAIQSRCAKLTFFPINQEHGMDILARIASAEGYEKIPINSIARIVDLCRGDSRKGVRVLQSCVTRFGSDFSPADVDDVMDIIPQHMIDTLFPLHCAEHDSSSSSSSSHGSSNSKQNKGMNRRKTTAQLIATAEEFCSSGYGCESLIRVASDRLMLQNEQEHRHEHECENEEDARTAHKAQTMINLGRLATYVENGADTTAVALEILDCMNW